MGWDEVSGRGSLRPAPALLLELLEEQWRVVGPSGRVLTCAVYRVKGPGVEVRAAYSADQFHCTRRVADLRDARAVAENWLAAMASVGYVELGVEALVADADAPRASR